MTDSHHTIQEAGVYRSYLVRFWQNGKQGQWRASAQCVQTGSTRLFGDTAGLLTFLNTEFTALPPMEEEKEKEEKEEKPIHS